MLSNKQLQILEQTWEATVFGNSFGEITPQAKEATLRQVQRLALGFDAGMGDIIRKATPGITDEAVAKRLNGMRAKTIGFGPALNCGEIPNTDYLLPQAVGVGCMYYLDETVDTGDDVSVAALEYLDRTRDLTDRHFTPAVKARYGVIDAMDRQIRTFALPQDYRYVMSCFADQVLLNEWRIARMSREYTQARERGETNNQFMRHHGPRLAAMLVQSAGFPSISSSLHAIYARYYDVPRLEAIHTDPVMKRMIKVSNAVVRALDDRGDSVMDSGAIPERGIETLNLCNQATPQLIRPFLDLAEIHGPRRKALYNAFLSFPESTAAAEQAGAVIVHQMVEHTREYFDAIPRETARHFKQYLILAKRVHEIGLVNSKMGDLALRDDPPA